MILENKGTDSKDYYDGNIATGTVEHAIFYCIGEVVEWTWILPDTAERESIFYDYHKIISFGPNL